ncbi:MAG: hypothetical protein HGB18_01510 [Candidatus Moranbacteria bacterium]|nr:hypothetical protein [Candidatus Moranbacteria bacterium]
MKKGIIIGVLAMVIVAGIASAVAVRTGYFRVTPGKSVIGAEAAKTKIAETLHGQFGVPESVDVEVKDVVESAGLYQASVTIQGKEYPMYLSLDGAKFFPNGVDTGLKPAVSKTQDQEQEIPKSDKPDVRLFVMSYCPYGTQIEKGILPVLSALGDKIGFTLEFVSYAMHDKKELDENLRQYCIRRDEPAKLPAYLSCFLKKGQGTEATCLKAAGVDAAKNAACAKAADTEFSVSKDYQDKSTYQGQFPTFGIDKDDNEKFGVEGSPTLVINGVTASSSRDSASLLKTICSAFDEAPDACATALSSDTPAPGFGEGTAAASSDANCGS